MLRAKEKVPYLIHTNGKDFLYIYGEQAGDLNFIELSDTNSVKGADNAQLHFFEEPKDPKNLPVRIGINVLGPAAAELRYHVGKLGKPTPNEDPEGYRYCTAADRKEVHTAAHQPASLYRPAAGRRPGVPRHGTLPVQRAPCHHGSDGSCRQTL